MTIFVVIQVLANLAYAHIQPAPHMASLTVASGGNNKPVAIAPKVMLNACPSSGGVVNRVIHHHPTLIPVVPVPATACKGVGSGSNGSVNGGNNAATTVFLAPCDSNGQITHFVLATAAPAVDNKASILMTPNCKVNKAVHFPFFNGLNLILNFEYL